MDYTRRIWLFKRIERDLHMRKTILILFQVLLLYSCSCRQEQVYNSPSFPVEDEVALHILSTSLQLSYPLGVSTFDDCVIVFGYSREGWIHVYDKNTGDYLGSHIPSGRGPGEVLNGIMMQVVDADGLLSVFDETTMEMYQYDISGLKQGDVKYLGKESFPESCSPVRSAWKVAESMYLLNGGVGLSEGQYGRFQLLQDGVLASLYEDFPVKDDISRKTFLSSVTALSPDMSKFADGTLFGGILETFDITEKGIMLRSCRMFYPPEITFDSGVVRHKKGMKWGFSSICASDDVLYGVFIGNEDPSSFNNISLFDWNGKELAKYETDSDILRLCCDTGRDDRLYAVSVKDGEYCLGYCDIP